MNRAVLLCDMDLTIADTYSKLIERLNEYYDLGLEQSKAFEYFGDHSPPAPPITRKQVEEVFSRDSFFLSLEPIDDSQKALKRLSRNFDIYIVTAPWMSAQHPYMDKYKWLKKYFPEFANKMIPTCHKQVIFGDILIDDHTTFCLDWKVFWRTRGGCPIVASLEYPWTDKEIVDITALNWNDLTLKIEKHFDILGG
jgi:5'(3')-deoxyribonucleotidase